MIAQGSFPGGPVTLQHDSGQPFRLIGFDFAETNIGVSYPPQIRVEGLTASGHSVSVTVALDGVNDGSGPLVDFEHSSLPLDFANLQSVTFTGSSGVSDSQFNFSVDNIQVGPGLESTTVPALSQVARWVLIFLLGGVAVSLLARH